jgi:addiction module HigA family antidote
MPKPPIRFADRCPTHPGEVLREDVLPASGLSKAEVARRLKISRQTPYDILAEEQLVSPAVAIRLGALFGGGGRSWVRMQAEYDLWHAERETDVSDIEAVRAA